MLLAFPHNKTQAAHLRCFFLQFTPFFTLVTTQPARFSEVFSDFHSFPVSIMKSIDPKTMVEHGTFYRNCDRVGDWYSRAQVVAPYLLPSVWLDKLVQQNTSRRTVIIAFCLARQTCCRSQFLWRCFIHHACLLTWPHSLCKVRPNSLHILCSFAAMGNRLLHDCRRRSTCHAPKFWPRCVCMLALCCRNPQMFVFHIADYSSR